MIRIKDAFETYKTLIMDYIAPDRRLGVSEGKHQYDLPLHKDSSSGFLRLLIGLMSFIAIMALSFSFALDGLAERWSSGLENKLTIEIPAQTQNGDLRSQKDIEGLQVKAAESLEDNPFIKDIDVLDEDEIQGLIQPWFGEELILKDIPLPGLISVELHLTSQESFSRIRGDMHKIHKDIQIDAHETWLNDILEFAGSLQVVGLLISIVILVTTVTAVASAVRSRMDIHRADVELLHLMGASDLYITKQFQRHALILALQGALIGTFISLILLMTFGAFISGNDSSMMPSITLGFGDFVFILLLPMLACFIAAFTARITVLRTLTSMP